MRLCSSGRTGVFPHPPPPTPRGIWPFISILSTQISGSDIPPACFSSVPLKERWCREIAQVVYSWKCHRQCQGWGHLYTCLSKHDQENWYACIQSNGGRLQRVVWTLVCRFRPVRHEMLFFFLFRYRLERIVLLRRSFTVRPPPRVFASHRVRYFSQNERIPVIYCCLNTLTLQIDELNVPWTTENCNTFLFCWIKLIIICITRLCWMLTTTRCSVYICLCLSTWNEVNKLHRERERERDHKLLWFVHMFMNWTFIFSGRWL